MPSLKPARTPDFRTRLDITPIPKGRPRFTKFGKAYTPAKTREFETSVQTMLIEKYEGGPMQGPVVIDLTFRFRRPKTPRHFFFPIVRGGSNPGGGDVDNYAKAVLDAGNGVLFEDDALIVEQSARKIYADEASIEVAIWSLNECDTPSA